MYRLMILWFCVYSIFWPLILNLATSANWVESGALYGVWFLLFWVYTHFLNLMIDREEIKGLQDYNSQIKHELFNLTAENELLNIKVDKLTFSIKMLHGKLKKYGNFGTKE